MSAVVSLAWAVVVAVALFAYGPRAYGAALVAIVEWGMR